MEGLRKRNRTWSVFLTFIPADSSQSCLTVRFPEVRNRKETEGGLADPELMTWADIETKTNPMCVLPFCIKYSVQKFSEQEQ